MMYHRLFFLASGRTGWLHRRVPVLLLLCGMFTLAGCATFAPDARPQGLPLPQSYAVPAPGSGVPATSPPQTAWWQGFASPELDGLIATALGSGFDVRAAQARLRQAEATARKSGADLWPALTGSGGADHARRSNLSGRDAPRVESTADSLSLGLAASYEVDLWGRMRALREADSLRAAAGAEDVRTASMTVSAEVADVWVALVAVRDEIRLVERQIETNKILLDALSLRFANALSTGLDVLQQQEVYAASLAELPVLRASEATLLTRLTILLGAVPGALDAVYGGPAISGTTLPALPALPAVGIPADVLDQRPDVRSAWLGLMAADWAVGAAQADRLPRLTLSADAGYAGAPAVLLSNWLTQLAAGLTAPLFDGGRRAAEVERLRAVADEQVQQYGKTVATAIGEVQDALVNETRQQEYVVRLEEQSRYAELARQEARQGYLNGRDDFLRFLTEHKNVQSLERRLLQQRATLVRYRVALHRALGGGF